MIGRIPDRWRVALATGVAVAALLGASGSSAAAGCYGRQLLQCGEKNAIFLDDVNWTHNFALDAELAQISPPVGLGNPALRGFWNFEASTAGARAYLEFGLGYEIGDQNFEQIPTRLTLPPPRVRPHGKVNRTMASAMNRLMYYEQQEVVDLVAMVTAMDRATEATYQRGRQDWVAWQQSAAAGFARQAANAIGHVIAAQRRVSKLLVKHGLVFGVGSEDLKLTQRSVRAHGLTSRLTNILQRFQAPGMLTFLNKDILQSNFGTLSFSLAQNLAAPNVISGQQQFAGALRHYAGRIPTTSPPPS